jgi:hypothetical protein
MSTHEGQIFTFDMNCDVRPEYDYSANCCGIVFSVSLNVKILRHDTITHTHPSR